MARRLFAEAIFCFSDISTQKGIAAPSKNTPGRKVKKTFPPFANFARFAVTLDPHNPRLNVAIPAFQIRRKNQDSSSDLAITMHKGLCSSCKADSPCSQV
jgi:hypothetical protein